MFLHYLLNESPDSMVYKFLDVQLKTKKKKDWIYQVLGDIEDLKLNMSLEELKTIKKSKLKSILKKAVEDKTFEDLQKTKETHSKVNKIQHNKLEMQRYLKPNNLKIRKEEAQTIFKLRSRVTDVKTNYKGKYDTFECDVCKVEEESQEHVLNCKEILKTRKDDEKTPEYKNVFKGNTSLQLEVAKYFDENMRRRKKMLNNG